ncbi:ArsR/SmtB family transcription factor [Flavisolibacter nicotianae]|uniref:ArsR/SmtB family transcription factor n=1 Tax=Flavisolibacter nicotianae TaxID=2364882 RepID=UPI000EABD5E6|nr:helix-turn-helix domain-containing protein [Flavisolibacter nicotianae]
MSTNKWDTPLTTTLFKALANPKRITILLYLHASRFATNKVITKYTGIPQPQTSAAMKALLAAELVTKEKVGTQWIYMVGPVWEKVKYLIL